MSSPISIKRSIQTLHSHPETASLVLGGGSQAFAVVMQHLCVVQDCASTCHATGMSKLLTGCLHKHGFTVRGAQTSDLLG